MGEMAEYYTDNYTPSNMNEVRKVETKKEIPKKTEKNEPKIVDIETLEEDIVEKNMIQNLLKKVKVTGFVYVESVPVQLEKFKFSKAIYGETYIVSDGTTKEELEKIKEIKIKEIRTEAQKQADIQYKKYNKDRMEF